MSIIQDVKKGRENERRILKILKKLDFEGGLVKNEFESFDIIDTRNKYFIEVKERFYNKNTFNDWMIGKDKIDRVNKLKKSKKYENYRFLFINSFKDGDYYVCIENLKDIDYRIDYFKRYRNYYNDKKKKYMFVNDNCFTPLDNYNYP